MVVRALGCIALAACGRIGFASHDAPEVAPAVCSVDRIALAQGAPADATLAIEPAHDGFIAGWLAVTANQLRALHVDAERRPILEAAVPNVLDDELAGIVDTGSRFVVATASNITNVITGVPYDLSASQVTFVPVGVVPHESFVSDASARHVVLGAIDATLSTTYIEDDGTVARNPTLFTAAGAITEIAAADGPDHGHAVYTDASGCTAAHIVFGSLDPSVGATQAVSDDCHDARVASGPASEDAMLVVWRSSAGSVEARYLASSGDVTGRVALDGRAPRVRFDGSRFWIAWRAEELHVATFDLAGTTEAFTVPDESPVGDDAFALVRRDGVVYLAILSQASLDLLGLCAGG